MQVAVKQVSSITRYGAAVGQTSLTKHLGELTSVIWTDARVNAPVGDAGPFATTRPAKPV